MSIEKKDIIHIAHISRITCSQEEIESLTYSINEVLRYIEILSSVDTSNINNNNLNHHNRVNIMREDIVSNDHALREEIINNASHKNDSFFVVPPMIERI